MRFFNTTGPSFPEDHYMLPPGDRLVGAQLDRYIRDKLYWCLHAPRQTGKTTFLLNWQRELSTVNKVAACYVSLERCQGITKTERAMPAICEAIRESAGKLQLPVPAVKTAEPYSMLSAVLTEWAALTDPKPLVVLFDETDVLEGDVLISFLRQLRDGFATRGIGIFPVSIALVGMRDLKDYITVAKGGVPVNPGSPFNIKEDSAVLSNFTKEDIARLFAQRTEETGQEIEIAALEYVWEQSRGQPWIVNSLFKRSTMRVLDEDCYDEVKEKHVREAREQIVLARETHLDSLAYRLKEPGVRYVMETLLSGNIDTNLLGSDAWRLCVDLGLVTIENGNPGISNPMYREVVAREITYSTQYMIAHPEWQWEKADGSLDMDTLLREFQFFWRRNSELWEAKSDYTEAFPHLLLMAFLQRVLNGGGYINREYAAGRGRMDLYIEYKGYRYIIEIKLVHSYETPVEIKAEGLKQIVRYCDQIGSNASAYLVIFDRRTDKPSWETRLKWSTDGGITVVEC
ncbi:MAG: PD-(D/E)XK nuclease domain-containing protein [Treponema sp.]|jgi:phage gp46-like protein|nr:PD-(D/E)XK nuclease domain-containing protein [Treponema sp.]